MLSKNYGAAKEFLTVLDKDPTADQDTLLSQLGYDSFAFEIAYNPNNALLHEMISSGSLKEITNTELRRHLTTWNASLESVRVTEQDLRLEREKIRDMFRRENASIRTVFDQTGISTEIMGIPKAKEKYSNLEIMKGREFENNLLTFIITAISLEQEIYRPLLQEIQSIRSLIDSEIKP
ncbi:hypothetical protein SAMN06265375_10557 [Muriicola jejuensis]|uniref:Uncharacterized protein n=1 Tax=Muriicola jejuensis TaxID=504488 RepID=A0A6P0UEN1_9FLAO|nr:hypothetical protein [Muriicola jejuensis]NER11695.1 hypothetical protein [Muriicola jejuensis]SMP25418.1 hypothetical protein SAMN06265375_10557 [Muriicola jejuensis]